MLVAELAKVSDPHPASPELKFRVVVIDIDDDPPHYKLVEAIFEGETAQGVLYWANAHIDAVNNGTKEKLRGKA